MASTHVRCGAAGSHAGGGVVRPRGVPCRACRRGQLFRVGQEGGVASGRTVDQAAGHEDEAARGDKALTRGYVTLWGAETRDPTR